MPIARQQAHYTATKEANVKVHGSVAEQFYAYDADDSGFLEQGEILEFCSKLGLKFTAEEARQALDEMEHDDTRDGQVSFDEFLAWWKSDSSIKRQGSIAGTVLRRSRYEEMVAQM